MNYRLGSSIVAAIFAASIAHAGPAEDAQAAVKKLADAANYSWTTITANAGGGRGFGGGPVNGVAEKGGAAVITRETQNGSMQSVVKGDKRVIQTQNGWQTPEELQAAGGRGGFGGGAAAFALPDAQLSTLLAGARDFTVADGAIVATLTSESLTPLLTFGRGGRGGGQAAGPRNASGTIKVWVTGGMVSKYELNVKGTISGRDGGEFQIDRTTTTEIKNVGSTKVEVPAAAQARLGA